MRLESRVGKIRRYCYYMASLLNHYTTSNKVFQRFYRVYAKMHFEQSGDVQSTGMLGFTSAQFACEGADQDGIDDVTKQLKPRVY